MSDYDDKNRGDSPSSGSGAHSDSVDGNLHLAASQDINPELVCAQLRSYWDELRGPRAIPDRAEVEPRGIRHALDYAFVLERLAPGAARLRLAGLHLVDLMGMEVRGMPICSFINPAWRGHFSDLLETVFRGPQIVQIHLRSASGYGRPEITGKMLILPLKSDLGDVTRALGCLVTTGEHGQVPRRFDVTDDKAWPVIAGAQVLAPTAMGFAEAPAAWQTPLLSQPTATLDPDATPEERRARFRINPDQD